MSELWTQLFLMLGNFEGHYLPICFGFLPDKTLKSYYIFLFMLLSGFKKLRPEISKTHPRAKLKLKVIKSDYELGIHQAFGSFFRIKVWV